MHSPTGSVEDYQIPYENLSKNISRVSEEFHTSTSLGGLKDEL